MTNIYLIYCSNDVLVNGSQDRILLCEFRVKVCCLFLAFLKETIIVTIIIIISVCLTIFGLNGGLILLSSRSFHLTSLKKGWCLIASSPPWFCAENKEMIKTSFLSNPGLLPSHNRVVYQHFSAWILSGWKLPLCSARLGTGHRHGEWTRKDRLHCLLQTEVGQPSSRTSELRGPTSPRWLRSPAPAGSRERCSPESRRTLMSLILPWCLLCTFQSRQSWHGPVLDYSQHRFLLNFFDWQISLLIILGAQTSESNMMLSSLRSL